MKVLLLSDKVVDHIYSASITERFRNIDFIISCGDLPENYLDFIVSLLNKPLFYVAGNHNQDIIYTEEGIQRKKLDGCINLDGEVIDYNGIILAGLEGSMKYSGGPHQYSEKQMISKLRRLKVKIFFFKILKKKYPDILVTHAPPFAIHDKEDLCHRGFKIFNYYIKKYKPRYLVHGHVHIYGTKDNWLTEVEDTKVVNAYGFRIIEI